MSMILKLRVIPNAKRNAIKSEKDVLKVYLSAPATEGKANKALIKFIAEHYDVKKSQVAIIRGEKSRDKLIEIKDK